MAFKHVHNRLDIYGIFRGNPLAGMAEKSTRKHNRHGVSRGPDVGATRCPVSEKVDPSSEESARVGLS